MTDLYRRYGAAPAPLPPIAYDGQGNAWTNLGNSSAGRAATGFVFFGSYDPSSQRIVQTANGYAVEDLPPPPPPPDPTSEDVNAEASRRIASGFMFQGKMYDYDDKAQKRITGAATLAGFAAGAGAPSGYLNWHGGEEPFAWIAMDNTLTEMDAPTCFAFGQAAAAWESSHVFAGRALKDMQPIPADFASDQYWP